MKPITAYRKLATVLLMLAAPCGAHAQGWGDQAPVQFRFLGNAVTNEVYRAQLGSTAATMARAIGASSAASAAAAGGLGQSSSQMSNVVQTTNNSTYNVTLSGDDNYLNFNQAVDASQDAKETNQDGSNASESSTAPKTTVNYVLN